EILRVRSGTRDELSLGFELRASREGQRRRLGPSERASQHALLRDACVIVSEPSTIDRDGGTAMRFLDRPRPRATPWAVLALALGLAWLGSPEPARAQFGGLGGLGGLLGGGYGGGGLGGLLGGGNSWQYGTGGMNSGFGQGYTYPNRGF